MDCCTYGSNCPAEDRDDNPPNSSVRNLGICPCASSRATQLLHYTIGCRVVHPLPLLIGLTSLLKAPKIRASRN